MHLRSYLQTQPHGAAKRLAEQLDCSSAYVSLIASDKKWPGRELWARIVAATDGQVSPLDHLTGRSTEDANG